MANYARGRNELTIGAIAILGIVVFAVMFMVLTDRGLSRHRSTLHVLLPSADKLKRGDPVLLRGVPVGEVRHLDFAPDGGVVVSLRLNRKMGLTRGATAALVGKDLFGSQAILLQAGDPMAIPLASHDTLQGTIAPALSTRLESLGDDAERLIGNGTAMLLHDALRNASSAAEGVRELSHTATTVLGDQAVQLTRTTRAMAEVADNLSRVTDSARLGGTMDHLEVASARLATTAARMDSASASLASILAKVDRGHGSLGRMVNDQALYEQLVVTVGEASTLVRDVREQPKRYLTVKVF